MERQTLVKFAMLCALVCTSGSVSSAQVHPHSIYINDAALQSVSDDTETGRNTFAFIGVPSASGISEFARDVSNIQQEPAVNLRIGAARSDVGQGYLPDTEQGQANITAYPNSNHGVQAADTGTLVLIALGIAALGLSRRRIKVNAIASGDAGIAADDSACDAADATTVHTPEHTRTTAKNPYPELRQSVQKLEALALEMQDMR